ncbi:hypothetical protein HJFPF1_10580 [Paramyrothecium foliicola]|nr:hypothetical protein HJFPF1_10580 [Paramyrothecium foliicola]
MSDHLPQQGCFATSEGSRRVLHNNLQEAFRSFSKWIVNDAKKSSPFPAPDWRPAIVILGEITQGSMKHDLASIRIAAHPRPNAWVVGKLKTTRWNIQGVIPSRDHERDTPYNLESIFTEWQGVKTLDLIIMGLEKLNFINDSKANPMVGVLCSLGLDPSCRIVDLDTVLAIISLSEESIYDGLSFFQGHFGPWRDAYFGGRDDYYTPSESPALVLGISFLETRYFHMRSLTTAAGNLTTGIQYQREILSIESTIKSIRLQEKRCSTHLTVNTDCRPIGNFVLLSIVDGESNSSRLWKEAKLFPAGRFTGLATFQVEIRAMIESWNRDWHKTLQHLSEMVSVTIASIDMDDKLKDLMYDPELKNTKLYFKILQTLRILLDVIRSAMADLECLSKPGLKLDLQDEPLKEEIKLILTTIGTY